MADNRYVEVNNLEVGNYVTVWEVDGEYGRQTVMAVEDLQYLPAADVRPVVRGTWSGYESDNEQWRRDDGSPVFLICDKCGNVVLNNGSPYWNFCPNCGADMMEG